MRSSAALEPEPWGAARAVLVAWCVLAAVNVLLLEALLPWSHTKPAVRLLHHAYDAGHLVALGLVSFAGAAIWQRFVRLPRWVALALLGLVGFAVALLTLRDDTANFLTRVGFLPRWLSFGAIAMLAGAALPVAWWAAARLALPRWRWIPIAGGLAIAMANHRVLQLNYPGVHLFAAWLAALAIGGGLSTLPRRAASSRRRRVVAIAGLVVLTTGAIASIAVRPNRTVWRELFRSSGSVLAPILARVLPARRGEHRPLVIEGSPWFRDRSTAPAVEPSGEPLVEKPIVVLITIDALRPDVLPKNPGRFPGLERVRDSSVEFVNARAPSPSTITTIASIFTGKYYSSLFWSEVDPGVFKGMFKGAIMPHADDSPRIAELLEKGGVRTTHVVPLWGLSKELGVGTGFSEEILTKRDYAPVADAMDLIVQRLERADAQPLFVYSHFVDPHAPYNLAGTHGTEYERYLREVELVDKQIVKLLDALERTKLGARTILIVSADHGEAFGEHGTKYHAVTVYEEMVRVPLFVRLPGGSHRVIREPVTLVDLGPTILDLYGISTPGHFMGQSLVPFLRGKTASLTRPIAVDAGRRMQALYFPDGMKAIVDLKRGTEELYDLNKDPGELENLVDVASAKAPQYLGAMRRFFTEHRCKLEGYEPPWRPF